MFRLRPATAHDAVSIRALVRRGKINPASLDWRRFVVAVTPEEEVIGCGQIKPHRDGSLELASIVVDPVWRQRGVARAVILQLLADHPGELFLMCRSRLGPFYEKFGFHPIQAAEMPPYFRRISRLFNIFAKLGGERDGLLVMKRGQERQATTGDRPA
jgi:amino-acid N-acetyltransferase